MLLTPILIAKASSVFRSETAAAMTIHSAAKRGDMKDLKNLVLEIGVTVSPEEVDGPFTADAFALCLQARPG